MADANLAQRGEQRPQVEGVDAAVDLADLALGRRRVLVLDDRGDPSAVVAHDPPVPVRAIGTTAVSTVAAAPRVVVRLGRSAASVAGRSSGTSPDSSTTVPLAPARCGSACSRRGRCRVAAPALQRTGPAVSRARAFTLLGLVPDDHDGRRGARAAAARKTCSISGSPAARWRTLGRADFMRVPFPAARITTWMSDMRQQSP